MKHTVSTRKVANQWNDTYEVVVDGQVLGTVVKGSDNAGGYGTTVWVRNGDYKGSWHRTRKRAVAQLVTAHYKRQALAQGVTLAEFLGQDDEECGR